MAWTERYANFDLTTGNNDGTSEANAWQTIAAMAAGATAGNRINIKRQASPYALSGNLTVAMNGTAAAPIWCRAYATTPGDGGFWEINHTGSSNTLNWNGTYNIVEGFKYSAVGSNLCGCAFNGDGTWVVRCKLHSLDNLRVGNAFRSYLTIQADHGDRRIGIGTGFKACFVSECVFRVIGPSTTVDIVYADTYGGSLCLTDCVFWGANLASQYCLHLYRSNDGRGGIIQRCYFYNFASHAIYVDLQPDTVYREPLAIYDCVFSSIGGYAIKCANTDLGYLQLLRNFYHSCTSGFTDYNVESQPIAATSLSASPFVDPANGDFNINNTAGGGAVLRALAGSMDPTL